MWNVRVWNVRVWNVRGVNVSIEPGGSAQKASLQAAPLRQRHRKGSSQSLSWQGEEEEVRGVAPHVNIKKELKDNKYTRLYLEIRAWCKGIEGGGWKVAGFGGAGRNTLVYHCNMLRD